MLPFLSLLGERLAFISEKSNTLVTLGVTTAATLFVTVFVLFRKRPKPIKPPVDLKDQSEELDDGVRVSRMMNNGQLVDVYFDGVQTLYDGFRRGVIESRNGPCLGTRTGPNKSFVWQSYQQVFDRSQHLGSGLIARGIQPSNDTFVGIYAQNTPEWVITEQACNMFSMCLVPLYDTLGAEACEYIINQTSMNTVVCDKPQKVESLLKTIEKTPSLKTIIVVDFNGVSEEIRAKAVDKGVEILSFKEIEDDGAKNVQEVKPPSPDDVATICYTSGTTGNPKGVMLTHKNIVSNVAAVMRVLNVSPAPNSSDAHLSYLPLAHMFERAVQAMIFSIGARIGFFQGDVKLLVDDLKTLQPTFFPTVPRLLNRMYDKVIAGVSGSKFKRTLLNIAMRKKEEEVKRGIVRRDSMWDKLVFHKVQDGLGGRVRFVLTGSAPLAENVLNFCRCAFGCVVMEGYGQTECTAGMTFTLGGEATAGHVGPPLPCNMVKLVDVPEMDYFAKDGKGEVCCKGNNVMKGYFRDPEKTKEALDDDGWLHSGDIGMWLPNGTLKIIDRKKHIFKLAQGEYIAPEKIENVCVRSPLVAQTFVEGNSLQPFLVAVVVPDPETLPGWVKEHNIQGKNMEDWCKSKQVKDAIFKDVIEKCKKAGLKSFELVRDISLFPELFSVDNGMLTPTFKTKRPYLRKYFSQKVQEMYDANAS